MVEDNSPVLGLYGAGTRNSNQGCIAEQDGRMRPSVPAGYLSPKMVEIQCFDNVSKGAVVRLVIWILKGLR